MKASRSLCQLPRGSKRLRPALPHALAQWHMRAMESPRPPHCQAPFWWIPYLNVRADKGRVALVAGSRGVPVALDLGRDSLMWQDGRRARAVRAEQSVLPLSPPHDLLVRRSARERSREVSRDHEERHGRGR